MRVDVNLIILFLDFVWWTWAKWDSRRGFLVCKYSVGWDGMGWDHSMGWDGETRKGMNLTCLASGLYILDLRLGGRAGHNRV